jgi:MSHA biogenesis protein MshO
MRRISDRADENMTPAQHRPQHGFTMIEAIIVIMITGIIAATIAVFMAGPVKGYFDTARRADMSDVADTALRRLARDVQSALPNSVRVSGNQFLEFVPIKDAGRYRTEIGTVGTDNPLDFSTADSSFDVLGPSVNVASGDLIVIFNMGQTGASVYDPASATANYQAANASAGNTVTLTAAHKFPYASPGSRFQVVSTAVTYACDGAGKLWRYSGYAIQSAQPASIAALNGLAGVTKALIAANVSGCAVNYASGVLERNGLVTVSLAITEQNETVTLVHQVNVVNTP